MATGNIPQFELPEVQLDEEALFARGIDGQLIREEGATLRQLQEDVHIVIDGRDVTVKRAVPLRNAQGVIVRDSDGRIIPRPTTIYDAAQQLYVQNPGDTSPIPVLCHQEHLEPAGACRICVVELFRRNPKTGDRQGRSKLVPSCYHRVEDWMEVVTIAQSDAVRDSVTILVDMLTTDHLTDSETDAPNELRDLSERLQLTESLGAPPRQNTRGNDETDLTIRVNHEACILCDRCVRSCTDVKGNNVIGRTGKGLETRIGFDLDTDMRLSSCVSCGECAISCPTDALTFRGERESPDADDKLKGDLVSVDELYSTQPLFAGIPRKFLEANRHAISRRRFKKGDILCYEGEHGSTAYIIEAGQFEVFIGTEAKQVGKRRARGLAGLVGGVRTMFQASTTSRQIQTDSGALMTDGSRIIVTPKDQIIGEMTCLNRYPRSATVQAIEEASVLEIRRNVLSMLQRTESTRRILDERYRKHALNSQLENLTLLSGLTPEEKRECSQVLKESAELVTVEPGQIIFKEGDLAQALFIVRLGVVKVSQQIGADERVLNYLNVGSHFGEIGLLAAIPELSSQLGENQGLHTASCTALDHVELVRMEKDNFLQVVDKFPMLRGRLMEEARRLLDRGATAREQVHSSVEEFLHQGLAGTQKLLVLDLESCTRCDECTKACSDTHDGITRLIREGLRFENYLIASACRSCLDPYCMIGCPVDAIHRKGDSQEIQIDNHCIGCGLCASNCPYGNINMHPEPEKSLFRSKNKVTQREDPQRPGFMLDVMQQKATTCDLCNKVAGGQPSCVFACPHEAAHRITGEELLAISRGEKPRPQ